MTAVRNYAKMRTAALLHVKRLIFMRLYTAFYRLQCVLLVSAWLSHTGRRLRDEASQRTGGHASPVELDFRASGCKTLANQVVRSIAKITAWGAAAIKKTFVKSFGLTAHQLSGRLERCARPRISGPISLLGVRPEQ